MVKDDIASSWIAYRRRLMTASEGSSLLELRRDRSLFREILFPARDIFLEKSSLWREE
jgi:hypothetical protein